MTPATHTTRSGKQQYSGCVGMKSKVPQISNRDASFCRSFFSSHFVVKVLLGVIDQPCLLIRFDFAG